MRRIQTVLIAALAALGSATALAQQGDGGSVGGTPGEFDFYVLALSWSPAFCATEGDRRSEDQCEPGRRLGFVVHGLWPQYERGYPSECGAFPRNPSRAALDEARDLYPSEGLARHEWRMHGTCSGQSPAAYFRDVRRARDLVNVPSRFQDVSAEQNLVPLEVERVFAAANPGLRSDMMAVACRRGLLREVRICLDKDLRGFRSCPQVDRSGCRGGELRLVPAR